MMQKNELVKVKIEDIGVGGEGIGKVDGYTLFIKDTIIGDVVEAKVMKAKKNYGYARLMNVLTPSEDRVEKVVCPMARKCGGCQIQEMKYPAQLAFKESKVRGNLERIGEVPGELLDQIMHPAVGMEVFCMCGIVGYSGKRSAQEVLLNGLEKLEYRGYDSAGVALALEGGIHVVKSKGRLEVLRRKLEAENLPESFCGIGHTRWATHGEPSDVNSHPHSTPRVSIVHNGIIENYGPLKADLLAKGVTFESETDTEVLVNQ